MIPDPGSPQAVEQGCTCPVADNKYGKGRAVVRIFGVLKPVFIFNMDCPLHHDGDWKDRAGEKP